MLQWNLLVRKALLDIANEDSSSDYSKIVADYQQITPW